MGSSEYKALRKSVPPSLLKKMTPTQIEGSDDLFQECVDSAGSSIGVEFGEIPKVINTDSCISPEANQKCIVLKGGTCTLSQGKHKYIGKTYYSEHQRHFLYCTHGQGVTIYFYGISGANLWTQVKHCN